MHKLGKGERILHFVYQNFTFYSKMSMHDDGFRHANSFQPVLHVQWSTLLLAACMGFGVRLNLVTWM